jgi:hypothetical protein
VVFVGECERNGFSHGECALLVAPPHIKTTERVKVALPMTHGLGQT